MAETNIRETLDASVFSLKEKQDFFKKKWRKDHIALIIFAVVVWLVIVFTLSIKGLEVYLVGAMGGFIAVILYSLLNNQMMAYVEESIYGGKWDEAE